MTRFDETISHDMSEDDRAFLATLREEPGLFTQMGAAFAGTMRIWTILAFILSFVFFAGAVWCAYLVFVAATPVEAIGWAAIGMAAFMATGFAKIWFWLRMNHLVVLREIKLLELQLSKLDSN